MTAIVRSTVSERRGVVILVAGEAGAGKSALVRALLARMEDEVSAFDGGCDDLLAPRSLGPFRDMAEAHPVLAPAMATTRIDEALPALLRAVSAQPSIVVVEDLHWADDATYDAIRFLARRLRDKPVALILTYRDEVEPDHPLRQVLGGLAGLPVQRVPLEPLSADGVRCLGAASAAEAHDLIQITGGNPFFVTEFLATRGLGVPVTVRDAVLARMGRLAPPVRVLLRRLSVVPTRAARTLAEQLAGGRHSVVVEAERSGVVVGGADWVAFRHELARQAIETSLLPGERIEANTLVVEALLDDADVEPARVVHHAVRSRRTDLILQFGPRAAEEASRLGAHRQAAEVLRVVLQHSTAGSPADRADLATRLAYSLYVVNRYEESLGYAEAAVRAAETANDTIALADALLVLSRVVLFARGPSRARAAAARAVELLRAAQDEARLAAALTELARAHSNLPTVGIVAEPCEESAKLSEQALELARNLRRPDVTAQALCYRGDARLAAGDQRGADDQRQAIALASADSRLETRVRAHVNAAGGAFRCGRFEDALRYVDDGLRLAADGEFFAGQYRLRLTAATVHASQGDWDTAATELRTLIETPGEPGVMAALARSVLARLLARRGDADAAAVLAAAVANPAFGDDALVTGVVTVAGIELGWLDGTLGELTPLARQAIVMTEGRYTAVHAELCGYLARAGVTAPGPLHPPGPWAPTLTDRWREASAAWAAIGERYEHAVVLATAPDRVERSRGLELLGALGAVATIAAL
jgi:tetratricopeptide (TPR) repeat protein